MEKIHVLGKNNQVTDLVGAVQGHQIGVRGVILDSVKADLTHSDNLTNITMVGNIGALAPLVDMVLFKMVKWMPQFLVMPCR